MPSNSVRKSDPLRPKVVRAEGESKQLRKVQRRKIPYRVGYNWNKGGRLKELRIRHLARKFLKIWIRNTFGRILPHEARFHYSCSVLRRAFEGWRDEWWTSRREWSLTIRAECHYRYYLFTWAFHSWRTFLSLQKEKKTKEQRAQSLADRRLTRLVWDRWMVLIETRRMCGRTLESALEQKRFSVIHWAWSVWRTRLREQRELRALESRATKQRAQSLQRKAWCLWQEMHRAACCQKEKESNADLHFNQRLRKRSFSLWMSYLSCRKTKKKAQAAAQRSCCLSLLRSSWCKWKNALHHKRIEESRSQAASRLAVRITQHRALERWKAYVRLRREEAERNRIARQYFQHHLLRAGLQGLSLNVTLNKEHRLNNNVAVQHRQRTMMTEYWKVWKERLEEAEDQSLQPLTEMAQTKYRISLLSGCFHLWREKLAEQKHPQAVLHDEQRRLQTAWVQWRQRTEEAESQEASRRPYTHRLLYNTVAQWKSGCAEMRDRGNRELEACRQGDLLCLRSAVEKWEKFVQNQREKRSRLKEIQSDHVVKPFKPSLMAWKKHHKQMSQMNEHAEELYRQQTQHFLRAILTVWREKAALLAEVRVAEQQAQDHYQRFLKLKVFLTWRETTKCAVLRRHQQGEALSRAQRTITQARLPRSFRRWRKQTREARSQRANREKAWRDHDSTVASDALRAWSGFPSQHQRIKVRKQQGILLLRLKMYQKYFEQWNTQLQRRRREANQTERALWHWSLTLQAKVLARWRLWVAERRSEREQAARATQVYGDRLLREGVTRILTYAAHMNDLTTSLTQFSQEQRSQRLQRIVKRCAVRWKQRALLKRRKEQEVRVRPSRKSVSFCVTEPSLGRVSTSESAEQEDGAVRHTQNEMGLTSAELALKPSGFSCPSHSDSSASSASCLHPAEDPASSSDQGLLTEFPSAAPEAKNQDILLPPSAFMTSRSQRPLDKSSCSGPGEAPLVSPSKLHPSASPDSHLSGIRRTPEDPLAEDTLTSSSSSSSSSALTQELLSIQKDMKEFQQNRRQLRAWRQLRGVLQGWLQTSAEDEQMEKTAVCEELKELEEHIDGLSAELEKRKPVMLLHAERIQYLQHVLQTSGVYPLC